MCFHLFSSWGFPGGTSGKESACQCRRHKRCKCDPWVRKIPWRRTWRPNPVFLPGESHGQRSLVGYNPYGCTESDMTEATQHACKHVLFLEKGRLHTLCDQFRMCLCLESGRCFSCSASVPAIPFLFNVLEFLFPCQDQDLIVFKTQVKTSIQTIFSNASRREPISLFGSVEEDWDIINPQAPQDGDMGILKVLWVPKSHCPRRSREGAWAVDESSAVHGGKDRRPRFCDLLAYHRPV